MPKFLLKAGTAALLLITSINSALATDAEVAQLVTRGMQQRAAGDFVAAEKTYKDALEMAKTKVGEQSDEYAVAASSLAGLYSASSKDKDAVDLYLKVIAIVEKQTGAARLTNLMVTYDNLAAVYAHLHEPDKALEYGDKALKYYESQPSMKGDLLKALNNRGALLMQMKQYDNARASYLRALDLLKDSNEDRTIAVITDNLADAYFEAGEKDKGYDTRKLALQMMQKAFGPEHPEVAKTYGNLAVLAVRMRVPEEAATDLEQQIAILRKTVSPNNKMLLDALNNYAITLQHLGREADAKKIEDELKQSGGLQASPSENSAQGK